MKFNLLRKLFTGSSYPVPSRFWVEQAKEETKHTPDYARLAQHEWQLMFVHDNYQRGHPKYNVVGVQSFYLCTAYTEGKFLFVKKKLGLESYPVAVHPSTDVKLLTWTETNVGSRMSLRKPEAHLIKGELHCVKSTQYLELDKDHRNTVEFDRVRVSLIIPYRKKAGRSLLPGDFSAEVKAWMYVGKQDYWEPLLREKELFSPVSVYKPAKDLLDKYYYYSRLELKDQ